MTATKAGDDVRQLSLPEELLLALHNEESGYFHQVPGWNLNCAVVGAALAELSLMGRLDADLESLLLLDRTETDDSLLDPILEEIASEPEQHSAKYWIQRLTPRAETVIAEALARLVHDGILDLHPGEFYTLGSKYWRASAMLNDDGGAPAQFVKLRLSNVIFAGEIPDPRDAIVISLIQACGVLPLMYQLNEEAQARIGLIARMDLIGGAIGIAVDETIVAPALQRPALTKQIPNAPLRHLILSPHIRQGNLPAMFARLAEQHGPVFQLRVPFQDPMIVLAGIETNRWAHRQGRLYLRSKQYFAPIDDMYGATRSIHSADGADHFRMRKALEPAYSRRTVANRLAEVYRLARQHMTTWTVGESIPAQTMLGPYMNAQTSPLVASINTQDIFTDVLRYKERGLKVRALRVLPRFMMHTRSMRRRAQVVDDLVERMQTSHAPAQRQGQPADVVDGYLSLHASDPQVLPESDLPLPLGMMLLGGMYLGDQLGFALYWMVANPDLYERIGREADALFGDGDPSESDFNRDRIDVTHRLLMETLRLTPIAPMSLRTVVNRCVVEDHELPVGARVLIAHTAAHYMEEAFVDPFRFDIDRYLAPRNEHVGESYAPYGLGTHACLGFRWSELHLAVNLLLLAHYFRFEFDQAYERPPIDPLPSQSLSNRLRFRIAEQRRELAV